VPLRRREEQPLRRVWAVLRCVGMLHPRGTGGVADGARAGPGASQRSGHHHPPVSARRRRPSRLALAWAAVLVVCLVLWLAAHSRLRDSTQTEPLAFAAAASCLAKLKGLGLPATHGAAARSATYGRLAAGMASSGLHIEGTQGVASGSMFRLTDSGSLEARLQELDTPVRAIVFRFQEQGVKRPLHKAVLHHFGRLVPATGIWLQDAEFYHSTVYHASPHQHPVPATQQEVETEVAGVAAAAASMCGLQVALERVVVSSAGVVMAAWQVMAGPEPASIRAALLAALPNAPPPGQQTVREPDILHTTLARLLAVPGGGGNSWETRIEGPGEVAAAEAALHVQ